MKYLEIDEASERKIISIFDIALKNKDGGGMQIKGTIDEVISKIKMECAETK